MRLVEQEVGTSAGPPAEATPAASYTPLVVVLLLIAAATAVLGVRDAADGVFTVKGVVSDFMAGFFLVFAAFKFMDLRGFAEGYGTYDLLAAKVPAYGFVYPFVELGFGLSMLAGVQPTWLLWTEVGVMAFSAAGVLRKLAKGEKFQCACLGTFLKVPLTKVTVVEDLGMAVLALYLLFGP